MSFAKFADEAMISDLVKLIKFTEKGMLIVGKLRSDDERDAVLRLSQKLNWAVYADITSGLRLTQLDNNPIRYFDQELQTEEFNELVKPEVVLHLGGRTTSKRLPIFLANNTPKYLQTTHSIGSM